MKNIWDKIPRWVRIWGFVILAMISGWYIAYPWGSVKYKVTVTIETPEGIKTGSAVRKFSIASGPQLISNTRVSTSVKGEAVAVDLGERGVVFAVMGTDDHYIAIHSFLGRGVGWTTNGSIRKLTFMTHEKKTVALEDRPLIVTFTDIKNPKTVTPVYRIYSDGAYSRNPKDLKVEDRFEEVFGKGVFLKDITIETTNEPVTDIIEPYLPSFAEETGFWKWLGSLKYDDPRRIGPDRFN